MALVITTPPPAPVESPKKVMTSQLAKEGIAVSTAMCEHFAMSRADLSQAVQVAELEAFSHIIERFGVGSGCDICRPAVASILASLHNRHVLAEGRAALQDTNAELDAHMARHIATYEDEWAAVLRDPVRLRQFASFVNASDTPDPSRAYVPERGQRRPATEAERDAAPVLIASDRLEVRS